MRVSATMKNISFVVKEVTLGVKQKLCGKTFTQEVFSILHLHHSSPSPFFTFTILHP
jgi:hypothetical protein